MVVLEFCTKEDMGTTQARCGIADDIGRTVIQKSRALI